MKRLPDSGVMRGAGKIAMLASPSMFSVYLLHTNAYGFELLGKVEDRLMSDGWNYYCMAFSVAIGMFGACVFLDLPRRAIGWAWRRICVQREMESV